MVFPCASAVVVAKVLPTWWGSSGSYLAKLGSDLLDSSVMHSCWTCFSTFKSRVICKQPPSEPSTVGFWRMPMAKEVMIAHEEGTSVAFLQHMEWCCHVFWNDQGVSIDSNIFQINLQALITYFIAMPIWHCHPLYRATGWKPEAIFDRASWSFKLCFKSPANIFLIGLYRNRLATLEIVISVHCPVKLLRE